MNWKRAIRFWAGALCATLWSWLALALCGSLLLSLHHNFDWGILLALPMGLLSLVAILFGAGVFATYFWIVVADSNSYTHWGELTVVIILSPLLLLGWWGICALVFAFLLAILPFDFGRDWGEDVWENRRWRHLFNLANDYERDKS